MTDFEQEVIDACNTTIEVLKAAATVLQNKLKAVEGLQERKRVKSLLSDCAWAALAASHLITRAHLGAPQEELENKLKKLRRKMMFIGFAI